MEIKSAKRTIIIVQYLSLLVTLGLVVVNESSLVSGQLNARDAKENSAGQSAAKYQKIVVAPNRLLPFRRLPLTNRYDYALTSMDQMTSMPSYLPMAYIMDRDMKNMNRYYTQDMPSSSSASAASSAAADQTEFVRIPNELSNDLFNLQSARFYPQLAAIKSKNQRLISSNEAAAESTSDNQQQQQQQQQSDSINVQTRSLASTGGGAAGNNNLITNGGLGGAAFSSVPRSFISVLYGRPGAGGLPGLPGIGGYNKKAEPKDNFFMHFG